MAAPTSPGFRSTEAKPYSVFDSIDYIQSDFASMENKITELRTEVDQLAREKAHFEENYNQVRIAHLFFPGEYNFQSKYMHLSMHKFKT